MKTSSVRSAAPDRARRLLLVLPAVLAACSTVSAPPAPRLDRAAPWALLPMVNHTETPQAGLRAEAILESLLRNGGVSALRRYPSSIGGDALFEPSERKGVDQAIDWARSQGARYAVTGTVDEWRYKVGVDGEPAVGFTLQVLEVGTGRVLWSAAGGRTGWSREALPAVAHQLLPRLSGPRVAAAR
ncbi:MAG TPA: penicillin-binding protein activator LpoB [Burkholderiaceae bacterium]|nr:penicillin-binding protein activator LpoB [Burkholderiaceae bacterium]